ncbi:MAG: 30S ribosomal protein S27ae [Promethearchaeota archaeon]
MGKKNKAASKKGSKTKKTRKALLIVDGGKIIRTNTVCPRCGPGFYMAAHYDRRTCGNCSYTQFLDKEGNVRGGTSGGRTRQRRPRRSTTASRKV